MTVALELDREARAARPRERVRPDRPDGDRDRGLGDLRRRGRRRLHRRRRRAARPRGRRARRRAALRRGPGLAAPSGVLRRHARADPRLARRTRYVLCHQAGATSSTATSASRSRRSPSSSSCTSGSACSRGRRRSSASRSTPGTSTRRRARAIDEARGRDRAAGRRSGALRAAQASRCARARATQVGPADPRTPRRQRETSRSTCGSHRPARRGIRRRGCKPDRVGGQRRRRQIRERRRDRS